MKYRPLTLCALAALAGTSACYPITFDCGGPESRGADATAIVTDAAGMIRVQAYGGAWERRGSEETRQLNISLQSETVPGYPPPVPAALVGHVRSVRLQDASGRVILRYAIRQAAKDEINDRADER